MPLGMKGLNGTVPCNSTISREDFLEGKTCLHSRYFHLCRPYRGITHKALEYDCNNRIPQAILVNLSGQIPWNRVDVNTLFSGRNKHSVGRVY